MNYLSMYSRTKNGSQISATVSRLDRSKNSWRVQVHASGAPLFMSHHNSKKAAYEQAERMHQTYIDVNGGKEA